MLFQLNPPPSRHDSPVKATHQTEPPASSDALAGVMQTDGAEANFAIPTRISAFEAIPNEVILEILQHFAVSNQDPDEPVDAEKRDGVRSLANLCVVSKRFEVLARPILYHSVTNSDAHSLLLLLRMLYNDFEISNDIKRLLLQVPFQHDDIELGVASRTLCSAWVGLPTEI